MTRITSTTPFRRGQVVLLPFPFTDQSQTKKRPAVILSTDEYNLRRAEIVVAPITSNMATRQEDDTQIADWPAAGLLRPGTVKGILGTVHQSLVLKTLGSLSSRDLHEVEAALAGFLGLEITSLMSDPSAPSETAGPA